MAEDAEDDDRKKLMVIAVSHSNLSGNPESRGAFEWTLNKIVRSHTFDFKVLLLDIQAPPASTDENADGTSKVLPLESIDMDRLYTSPNDFNNLKPLEKNRVDLLRYFVRRCHDSKIACEAWIKMGSPKTVIADEVKHAGPDLLVLGRRGIAPEIKLFHYEKIQALSPADDPTKLMIAVSQSRWSGYPEASFSSRGAFEWTLNKIIGSNTSEFKFLILHVQAPVPYKNGTPLSADGTAVVESHDMGRIYTSPNDFNDLKCPELLRGVHLLEFFVKRCHDENIACEAWINMGSPNVVIPVEVQRVKPDLLLLGNRDIPRHMKPTVESVSDCARRVNCPVLIVKRSAEFANLGFDPVAD